MHHDRIIAGEPATVMDWRDDPRAVTIFDSIRANPPRLTSRQTVYVITRDEWAEYVGERVDRLEAIYSEHETAHRLKASDTDDWSDYDAFSAFPTVQRAIDEALSPVAAPVAPQSLFDGMMAGVVAALRPARGVVARG